MTRSRYYIQCDPTDHINRWSDEAFWDELRRRLPAETAEQLITGPSLEKSIAPLRSFVAEPMQFGRLLLAGDAAHVVPPTGAKGLNLAFSDIYYLHQAIESFFADNDTAALPHYSQQALARVWKTERFSWYLTNLTHRFNADPFEQKMKEAELDYITASPAGRLMMAENYVGLPL
jgi:p-hydroxybenzoate 3-monooxygenase